MLEKTSAEKVNIIAHSRGGLEARYVIGALGMENAVASLTTMATPHAGSKTMNIALKFPDKDGIYYQSYATALRFFFSDLIFFFLWPIIRVFDGPNDGLCPAESARWKNFRGVVTGRVFGVSHSGIIDLYCEGTGGNGILAV